MVQPPTASSASPTQADTYDASSSSSAQRGYSVVSQSNSVLLVAGR